MDWYPGAVRRPGPAWKVGYSFVGEEGPKRGDVKHSAEGYWAGIHSVLDGPRRASWHFTIGYDRVEQHYPRRAHCWHAGDVDDDGGVAANIDLDGIEHLGMAGTPLNAYQVEETAKVSYWLAEQEERDTFERFDGWSPDESGLWLLVEHNEVSDWPTACPSNRVPWPAVFRELEKLMISKEVLAKVATLYATAEAYATLGLPMPADVKAQLRWLLNS